MIRWSKLFAVLQKLVRNSPIRLPMSGLFACYTTFQEEQSSHFHVVEQEDRFKRQDESGSFEG